MPGKHEIILNKIYYEPEKTQELYFMLFSENLEVWNQVGKRP